MREESSVLAPGEDRGHGDTYRPVNYRERSGFLFLLGVVLLASALGATVGAMVVLGFKPSVAPVVWVGGKK